jgi:hypothetical protein
MGLRWYGNRQYTKGQDAEKVKVAEQIQKAANDARDAARLELQQERESIAKETAANLATRRQFERDRQSADASMRDRLSAIVSATQEGHARVLETSDADLVSLIRDLNRELEPVPVVPDR